MPRVQDAIPSLDCQKPEKTFKSASLKRVALRSGIRPWCSTRASRSASPIREPSWDFLNEANANQFIADGLLNLNTFFGLTDGGQFCSELNCGSVLEDISFASNVSGLTIAGFDPTTGAIDPTTGAVPEPGTWALMVTGMLGLCGLGLRRRVMAVA